MTELALFPEVSAAERCVHVAVPLPLRRLFTYKVPASLARHVQQGTRVAVPFGKRKLAAFVIGDAPAPDAGMKVRAIADALDAEPLFAPELLSFLVSAADYYMHPLGEVLRAAAPALETRKLHALRKQGFLDEGEQLPGRRVTVRTHTVVRASIECLPDAKLGPSQAKLLSRVIERRELPLSELRTSLPNARGVARALTARGVKTARGGEWTAVQVAEHSATSSGAPSHLPGRTR